MILATLLLLSGLSISVVAIYYSVMGLMAIFSAAAIPIAIMGVSLEIGKLVIASWIKAYWEKAPLLMRSYGVVSVCILMMITTLGCFGYLSKAHSDQTLVSGDVQAKIAIYDEKIKTARENIETDRKQLRQMDEAVDQIMARSDSEKGAEKAATIRRSQQRDRNLLVKDIETNQVIISQLNDQSAPVRAENRKVEAEVGPIKYIAAVVYGSNPDSSILERAVTWVIILIVVVFDPLAVVMLLAAQMTFDWIREDKQAKYEQDDGPLTVDQIDQIKSHETSPTLDDAVEQARAEDQNVNPSIELPAFDVQESEALSSEVDVVKPDPQVAELEAKIALIEQDRDDLIEFVKQNQEDYVKVSDLHQRSMHREVALAAEIDQLSFEINKLNEELLALKAPPPAPIEYSFEEELHEDIPEPPMEEQTSVEMTKDTQSEIVTDLAGEPLPEPEPQVIAVQESVEITPTDTKPEVYITDAITKPIENILTRKPNTGFGSEFPNNPTRGDLFLRTDFKPSRLFKWNDIKWIEVNKSTTDAYSYNDSYIQFLAEKLSSGEYSIDDLTDTEIAQVQNLLGGRHA
jgi:hypothetical protein